MKYPIKNRFPSHDLIHIDLKCSTFSIRKTFYTYQIDERFLCDIIAILVNFHSSKVVVTRRFTDHWYHEHLRFKKSAAHKVLGECDLSDISIDGYKRHGRFSQIVVHNNNCNTEIKSQNG